MIGHISLGFVCGFWVAMEISHHWYKKNIKRLFNVAWEKAVDDEKKWQETMELLDD